MERPDDEAPLAREPWHRLLGGTADGPSETTDARIRAHARRALTPRGRRWWLPASLAASFVLAVLIAQSQFGTIRRAPMTESDRTGGAAMEARISDRDESPESREIGATPAAAAPSRKTTTRQESGPEDYGDPDAQTGSDEAGVAPVVGGPERDVQAASELADRPAVATPAMMEASAAAQASTPTPEDWYAAIEKLRAEGRIEEAERELERLRKAWPGWLEQQAEYLKRDEGR
jgi:hypothetical protein